jgi:hypothetical protein
LRWTACPPLASGDGVLGVAPAASFVLTTALATLALSNRSLPAALCDKAPAGPLARSWVSFHDQQAAALAVLSGPAEARP